VDNITIERCQQDLIAGKRQVDIARELGISQASVSRINTMTDYQRKLRPADVREIRRLVDAGLRHALRDAKVEVTQAYIRRLSQRLHDLFDYTDWLETDQLELLIELPPGLYNLMLALLRYEHRVRPYRDDVPADNDTDATLARETVHDGALAAEGAS
jgi:hypothetical protein